MNFEIVKPEINNEDLINLLSMNFPEIKDELYDIFNNGIIHLQMAVLSRYTNKNNEKKQFDKIKKIGITVPLFKNQTTLVFEGHFEDFDAHVHVTTSSQNYVDIFNKLVIWKNRCFPDSS